MKKPHPYKSTTHQERYYHFTDLKNDKIKAITAFARKVQDAWWVSFSFCVKDDQFERRCGREVARRRWFEEGPSWFVGPIIDYESVKDLAMKALSEVTGH